MLLGTTRRRSLGCQNWTKLVIISVLAATSIFSQTFTQITTGALVSDGSNSTNQAWGDYDNDGDLDLFVPTYNAVDLFYSNNGDGTFSQITVGALVQDATRAYSAAWADYDNDGFLDLFVSQVDNWNNTLYHNNGDGTFTKITTGSIVNDGGNSYDAAWADYDLDGDVDLLVVNDNQANFLYRNQGNGTFARVTNTVLTDFGGYRVSWADFDADSYPDVLVQQHSGTNANRLFRNNGNGSFTQIVAGILPNATYGNPFWGDFDNDGDLDLFLAREGTSELYRNDGGNFTSVMTTAELTSNSAAWADFDNDGWLDLYVANNGTNSYYHNNGDGSFSAITAGEFVTNSDNSFAVSATDADGDGALDLFVSNYSSQNNQLYMNDGNANHWFAVDLVGELDNTAGLTATIQLKAGDTWQTRHVLPTDGAPLQCHFGLGSETVVDSIIVDWPQGSPQVVTNLAADQTITITQEDETPSSVKLVDDPTLSTNYNGYAVAWGDYDNDGYPDLFVPTYNDVDRLYHNNGDGTFSQITTGALVTTATRALDADWGDYNNDGYLDLFVAQTDNWNNSLYRNNGDGTFTAVTEGNIVSSAAYSQGASWWDFDRDGDLDLHVANANNQVNQLFRNNGDGSFTNLSG
ncbi:MAG: VCBS repeat-containing protein, partial [Candidatus Marinimicrobia bacterium]|nr:VCBS repeat-containing protein [Candidatus Neomarinimicrobiota bacterium]